MVHDIVEELHLLRVLHHLLWRSREGFRRIIEIERHHIPIGKAHGLQVECIGGKSVQVAFELTSLFVAYRLLEGCHFIARLQVRLWRVIAL